MLFAYRFLRQLPFVVLLCFVVFAADALAQPLVDSSITLINVSRAGRPGDEADFGTISRGENVAVRIAGCKALYERAQILKVPLILYLDNIPLSTIHSFNPILPDFDTEVFLFNFLDNEQTDSAWHHLLPGSVMTKTAGRFKAFVTAGLLNDRPIFPKGLNPSNAPRNLVIILFNKTVTYIFYVLYVILAFCVYKLCQKRELIKTTLPSGSTVFSLSKTQLLLWTMIVVGSYIYIWIITLDLPTIDGSVLILLGISVGTSTISRGLDNSNFQKPGASTIFVPSKGIIYDVLSDDQGLSVHRLQNVLFTVVIMCVFVANVLSYLQMPAIDSTLLALMGISSAGYLSGKPMEVNTNVPRNNPPPPPPPAAPPTPPVTPTPDDGSAPLPPQD